MSMGFPETAGRCGTLLDDYGTHAVNVHPLIYCGYCGAVCSLHGISAVRDGMVQCGAVRCDARDRGTVWTAHEECVLVRELGQWVLDFAYLRGTADNMETLMSVLSTHMNTYMFFCTKHVFCSVLFPCRLRLLSDDVIVRACLETSWPPVAAASTLASYIATMYRKRDEECWSLSGPHSSTLVIRLANPGKKEDKKRLSEKRIFCRIRVFLHTLFISQFSCVGGI